MSSASAPMDVSSEHAADLLVQQRDLQLDAVRAWTMTIQPMTFHRSEKLIERSDPATFNICLLLDGTMTRAWGAGHAVYHPGELHISDSSQPFELRARSADEAVSCVGAEIPKRLLPSRSERLIGHPLSGRAGVGALLAQFLTRLAEDTGCYRSADGPRLGLIATDLTSALIAHHLDDGHRPPPDTHRRTLVLRIRAFIQHHLADPDLTPRTVAAAHHISLSYLHRLFEGEQFTVAAWIRHQRLEHARRDLADREFLPTPIHAIAARWGFTRPADFTRAFRTTYEITPMDFRRRALQPSR
ncbi:helix-turn-helix domain-containing protein [Actinoallomurus iriomotensis]|nr:helix-turn-helix domain-containing protein [Actinoallomurus iriomotensis]